MATGHGATLHLWLELAAARDAGHPHDASGGPPGGQGAAGGGSK